MTLVTNPIALAALARAQQAARIGPPPRARTDSRTADKFVIRGYAELFTELNGIGLHQGRSSNSEMVAAILDALSGHQRSNALLHILKSHIGESIAERVLTELPDFDLGACKTPQKFVIRFPMQVRDAIRDGVATAIASEQSTGPYSMNGWVLNALVGWVKFQRQQYALLSAAMAMDQTLLGG
ncbi:Arc family DNA-binding protein [Pseudomonas sp. MWU12-2323]|uniref:Arc family DNA-binding protein n=1 Tax=Pseudomonas sp. MWU12-2323 TaxID=2651296 RepID=UPI00128D0AF4|nr:Arc family DNA-binding protein [Pseudomonas sp. MWU12-2323]MPQ69361.1 Arc family DNA-binding protein [Pseudomonas sp. MWU12-2323]